MQPIDKLAVYYHEREVGTLTLSPDRRICVFEYNAQWLVDGFSISPLELPLKSGAFTAPASPFYGNFGIFEDSLPDGYGRYLLHKTLRQMGVDDRQLSALDRLSIVGDNGMGALCYRPVSNIVTEVEVDDLDLLQAKALAVLSEQQESDSAMLLYNSGNSGGARPKTLLSDADGHWLVKFRHTYDPADMGVQEYRYNELARQCGIDVPDFKLFKDRYFASRRFDIDADGNRCHTATAGALLNISLSQPVLDYSNLLALTGWLTQSQYDVEQMFRRMVFNYLIDNKDDHCKNFSFIVRPQADGKWQWRLAPAYDLTLCAEGYNGQHATSVNGTDRPQLADYLALGAKIRLPEQLCRRIVAELTDIVRRS